MPLRDEERLFIDAIRGLNTEAGKLLEEENQFFPPDPKMDEST
jgi:hypothetical protein